MAVYTYECKKCEVKWDVYKSMDDVNKTEKCADGHQAVRMFNNFTIGIPNVEKADYPYTGKRR